MNLKNKQMARLKKTTASSNAASKTAKTSAGNKKKSAPRKAKATEKEPKEEVETPKAEVSPDESMDDAPQPQNEEVDETSDVSADDSDSPEEDETSDGVSDFFDRTEDAIFTKKELRNFKKEMKQANLSQEQRDLILEEVTTSLDVTDEDIEKVKAVLDEYEVVESYFVEVDFEKGVFVDSDGKVAPGEALLRCLRVSRCDEKQYIGFLNHVVSQGGMNFRNRPTEKLMSVEEMENNIKELPFEELELAFDSLTKNFWITNKDFITPPDGGEDVSVGDLVNLQYAGNTLKKDPAVVKSKTPFIVTMAKSIEPVTFHKKPRHIVVNNQMVTKVHAIAPMAGKEI